MESRLQVQTSKKNSSVMRNCMERIYGHESEMVLNSCDINFIFKLILLFSS